MKKNYKFLNLHGLSTESFLGIWLSQYKFLVNEFLINKKVSQTNVSNLYLTLPFKSIRHDAPQNVFDHCAQTLRWRKLKLGDF